MGNTTRRGFTLVELSILLVIIGLLAGAVLVGRDLIRHAEFVKLHSQYTELVTAINTFRTKYNCLPGDCPNATAFLGTYSGMPQPPLSTATHAAPAFFITDTFGSPTLNGDGDGRIDAKNTMYEMSTHWQHLAATGLISGSYTGGISTQGGSLILPGVNCPRVLSKPRCWIIFDGNDSVWRGLLGNPPLTIVPVSLGAMMTAGQAFGGSLLAAR